MLDEAFLLEASESDPEARALYGRHYSAAGRRASRAWVGPGERLILRHSWGGVLVVWRRERFRLDGRAGVNCSVFRLENPRLLASAVLLDAMDRAWRRWPGERLFTFVDPARVRGSNPGYCFIRAGWMRLPGRTSRGLVVLVAEAPAASTGRVAAGSRSFPSASAACSVAVPAAVPASAAAGSTSASVLAGAAAGRAADVNGQAAVAGGGAPAPASAARVNVDRASAPDPAAAAVLPGVGFSLDNSCASMYRARMTTRKHRRGGRGPAWTPAEDAAIREAAAITADSGTNVYLREEGRVVRVRRLEEVAARLGRTTDAVRKRAQRIGACSYLMYAKGGRRPRSA